MYLDGTKVLKGYIFYMDCPAEEQPVPVPGEYCVKKKRPYIVLSNDNCNATSPLIHVAPLTTKPPKMHQWYKVPFKTKDGSCRWIDVAYTVLVPRTLCNVADFSESLTQCVYDNKEFWSRLNCCLAKQFGIENIIMEENTMETSVNITREEIHSIIRNEISNMCNNPNVVVPNISITVNIPGNDEQCCTNRTGTITNNNTDEKSVKSTKNEYYVKSKNPKRTRLEDCEKKRIMEYILACSCYGKPDLRNVAQKFGVSYTTAYRFFKKMNK